MLQDRFRSLRPARRSWPLSYGLILAAFAGSLLLVAWQPSAPSASKAVLAYGPSVPLGEGQAKAYLILEDGKPIELGVALSERALFGLPAPSGHGAPHGDAHHEMEEYILDLPHANPTPFRSVQLNWNPAGHEPPGIYDLPHFDFHFHLITNAERLAIDPADPAFTQKAAKYPGDAFLPPGYVAPAPVAIPFMGVHWVDPTSPELRGEKFTETMIYGTWDGRLIFIEPMITREFLASRPDFTTSIAVPPRFAAPGYYPSTYAIRWDGQAKEYRVSLGGFARHD